MHYNKVISQTCSVLIPDKKQRSCWKHRENIHEWAMLKTKATWDAQHGALLPLTASLFLPPLLPAHSFPSPPPPRPDSIHDCCATTLEEKWIIHPQLRASKQWYQQSKGIEGQMDDKMMIGVIGKWRHTKEEGQLHFSQSYKREEGWVDRGLWDTETLFF